MTDLLNITSDDGDGCWRLFYGSREVTRSRSLQLIRQAKDACAQEIEAYWEEMHRGRQAARVAAFGFGG